VQLSIIISLLSSNSLGRRNTNECTNAHHTLANNGGFTNYNIILVLSFKKYFSVIFNEQIGLYYANEQCNH